MIFNRPDDAIYNAILNTRAFIPIMHLYFYGIMSCFIILHYLTDAYKEDILQMNIIDDFILYLNEDYDIYSLFINLLQLYSKDAGVKIHVISYKDIDVREVVDECLKKWKQNKFDFGKSEVFIVESHVISMNWVESYLDKLSPNDYVFILGSERLLPYTNSHKVVETKTDEITYNSSYLYNEDWCSFAKWIDIIYEKYQNKLKGIICTIFADSPSRKLINSYLEESKNLSIVGIMKFEGNQQKKDFDFKLFYDNLTSGNYDFLIDYLENKKEQLERSDYIDLLKDTYINFGFIEDAIELLLKESDLRLDHKKLLIDLMITKSDKHIQCKQLANEIFECNRFTKDLMPTILRIYEKSDEFDKWLKLSLEIDPDNPKIIENYANWLSDKKYYFEAAQQFKRLKSMTHNAYYDLPERMNMLLNNPSKDYRANMDYLLDPFTDKPNDFNDALYRICLYYQLKQPSDYITYTLLNRIDYSGNVESQIPLLQLKSMILQDVVSAKRALGKLKPHRNEKHRIIIGKERIKFIVKSIVTFAKVERGYLEWGEFIDQAQSKEAWRTFIIDELIYWFSQIREFDVESAYKNSWANSERLNKANKSQENRTMILLKALTSEEYKNDDIDNLIIGILKSAELVKSERLKIWGRFYSAILKTHKGLFQESNDLALTILEYYDKVPEEYMDTCIQLGLTSWAVSQYMVGRETEGMLCLLASVFNLEASEEVLPLIEFGLPIVCNFIQKNYSSLSLVQKGQIVDAISRYESYNSDVEYTKALLSNELKMFTEISNLSLGLLEKKSLEWRVALVHNIDGLFALEKSEQAIKMINLNAELIVDNLMDRIDIRPNIILGWLRNIQLSEYLDTVDKDKIYYLISIALDDFEQSRKVKHKTERAAIGEKINELARLSLEFFGKLEGIENESFQIEKSQIEMISRYISYLTPRAFAEQKKYYKNNVIDQELKTLEKRYNSLRKNYQVFYQKSEGKSNTLNIIGLKLQELQEILKVEHPNYRPLAEHNLINIEVIQNSMVANEVCFQYVLLNNYILQLMITNKKVLMLYSVIDVDAYHAKLEELNHILNDDGCVSKELLQEISSNTVSLLFQENYENDYIKLFMIPDLSLGAFNSNLCFMNQTWLIDKFVSIKCLMDYNVILKSYKSSRVTKIGNRIFGNEQENNLNHIKKYLIKNQNNSFLLFDNDNDEISSVIDEISLNSVNSLFIYGHGVTDQMMNSHGGAQGIQGRNRLIRPEKLLKKINSIENLLFLSCSSGVPLENRREDLAGYWSDVFSTYEGVLVLCRWNVLTKPAIELVNNLKNILLHNGDLSKSLIMAMKVLKSEERAIGEWSGMECWIN